MAIPTLTAVSPSVAEARGGTVVFLEGTGFEAPLTVEVLLASVPVAAFDVNYDITPTSAFFGTPVLAPDTYEVRVTNADGTSGTVELVVKKFAEQMKVEQVRQKWSPIWKVGPRWLSDILVHPVAEKGLLQALVEALHGGDNDLAGQYVTRLTAPLSADETTTMEVQATPGFGENTDGASDALLLVNGEVIFAAARTDTTFDTLSRGQESTSAKLHPEGSLVYDLSQNVSARDLVRRGLLVDFARGLDLDVIGSNLGLTKCPTIGEEQWRRFIKAVAYLPKMTWDAFNEAMLALTNDATAYTILEEPIRDPYNVTVEVVAPSSTGLRGRFYLNSGTPGAWTGHYLADNETVRDDGNDFYAYLSDPGTLERCALNQVRAAGVGVEVRAKL